MTEIKNAKGIVTWVSKFGFQIDNVDVWYNGDGVGKVVNKGDSVDFEYLENEGKVPGKVFRNVLPENIKVLSSAPSEPVQASGQEIGLRRKLATECVLRAAELLGKNDIEKVNPSVIKTLATSWFDMGMEIADKVDTEEPEPVEESSN